MPAVQGDTVIVAIATREAGTGAAFSEVKPTGSAESCRFSEMEHDGERDSLV